MSEEEGRKEFELLKVNRYEVEENAVFLDYDVETLLGEIKEFEQKKYAVRLSFSKNLLTIKDALKEYQTEFGLLLAKIAGDHEELQLEIMGFFRSQTPFVQVPSNHQNMVLDPLLILAKGQYLEIKEESCNIISQLAHLLDETEQKSIIQFADALADSTNEENKIAAIQLLAKLTPDMSPQKKQLVFEHQFLGIYKNASVRVKKQIILELGRLSQSLNVEFVETNIIRNFYIHEGAEHAWGIRKACVQILNPLLVIVKNCKEDLAQVLLNFLKDGNKFVRIAAHKVLPQFVAKYGSKNVPDKLFDYYVSLIDLDINNQVSKTNQIIEKVAFYFPGVLLTVGRTRWPQLKKLFHRLLHFSSEEVKLPIAESLFAIGSIIGPQQSKQTLFAALDYILKQPSDYLKLCAIKNLAKFVQQFQKQTRQNLIDVFLVLQKDPKKWRVRHSISQQLKELSAIYDPETIFKYILPISLKLCNDAVSEVRVEASRQIVHVINNFKNEEHLFLMAIESLKGYAASEKYIQRQTFCLMLESLYDETSKFQEHFFEIMTTLAADPIPLVRISLAISISKIMQQHKIDKSKFQGLISKLKEDEGAAEYFLDDEEQTTE